MTGHNWVLTILFVALALGGCKKETESAKANAPVFEIREISCKAETFDAGWSHTCQGTLLARDPEFQNAEVIVWYRDRSGRPDQKEGPSNRDYIFVLMSHGVATLSTGAYYSKKTKLYSGATIGDYETDPGPPTPKWEIIGYSRLEPANLKVVD